MGTTLELALASQSPRRRDLLTEAGFSFRVFPIKVSEIFDENLTASEQASHLATEKALAAISEHKQLKSNGFLVLGADTIVALNETLFGKPENFAQATEFLRHLSGKTHRVITGFSLHESGTANFYTGFDETLVEFRNLSEKEIFDYVATGEPMDKAGAYALQGKGGTLVASVRGSRSNVIGLPIEAIDAALKKKGWHVHRTKSK